MNSGSELVLMDADRIRRSLKRMAHEIVEKNPAGKSILFFGIDERGYVLAQELTNVLKSIFPNNVEARQLLLKHGNPEELFTRLDTEQIKDRYIIVVDDVIFSGSTMFIALTKIAGYLDPPELHTAVMIDRGHRKFPIKAEFCGMELPTKLNEHVSVQVKEQKIRQVVLRDMKN